MKEVMMVLLEAFSFVVVVVAFVSRAACVSHFVFLVSVALVFVLVDLVLAVEVMFLLLLLLLVLVVLLLGGVGGLLFFECCSSNSEEVYPFDD